MSVPGEREGSPWWRPEIGRSVPLTALVGLVAAILGYAFRSGEASSSAAAFQASVQDRLARMELEHAKDLKLTDTTLGDRIGRLETNTGTRFDAIDRRREQTLRDLKERGDAADKRDEQFSEALGRLDNRMTRMEALREFNAQNGPGSREADGFGAGTGRSAPGTGQKR